MGRKKSSTSEMNVYQKQDAPLAKALRELVTNTSELANFLDVSVQAVNQYRIGTTQPTIERICKIADFYGVTVDYLLGRTTTKTINADVATAVKTTGLSEDAIMFFDALHDSKHTKEILSAVNMLFSETRYDDCISFWKRLQQFLFSSSKPYMVPIGEDFVEISADAVLSLRLTENNQYLQRLREEIQNKLLDSENTTDEVNKNGIN